MGRWGTIHDTFKFLRPVLSGRLERLHSPRAEQLPLRRLPPPTLFGLRVVSAFRGPGCMRARRRPIHGLRTESRATRSKDREIGGIFHGIALGLVKISGTGQLSNLVHSA